MEKLPTFKPDLGFGETAKTAVTQVMPLSQETPEDIGERDMDEDFQSMLEPADYSPQPKHKKDRAFVGSV